MKVKESFLAFKFRVLTSQSPEAETLRGNWENNYGTFKLFFLFLVACQFFCNILSGQLKNELKISVVERMRLGNFMLSDTNEIYDAHYVYFTIENTSNFTQQITIPSAIYDALFLESDEYRIISKKRAFEKIKTWELKPNQKLIMPRYLFIPISKIHKGINTYFFEFVWVPLVKEFYMFNTVLREHKKKKLNILGCKLSIQF